MTDGKPLTQQDLVKWLRREKSAISELLARVVSWVDLDQLSETLSCQGNSCKSTAATDIAGDWLTEWGQDGRIPSARFPLAVEYLYTWLITTVTVLSLSRWQVEDLPASSESIVEELSQLFEKDGLSAPPVSAFGRLCDWLGVRPLLKVGMHSPETFFQELAEWSQKLVAQWNGRADSRLDFFDALLSVLFPKKVRLQRGEFYTPYWLADHILTELNYPGEGESRLLDPACGSGVFLVAAVHKLIPCLLEVGHVMKSNSTEPEQHSRQATCAGDLAQEVIRRVLGGQIVGMDVNASAVIAARANLLLTAVHTLRRLCPGGRVKLRDVLFEPAPVYWADSLNLSGHAHLASGVLTTVPQEHDLKNQVQPGFQFLVGNPPWLLWDNLDEKARQRLAPLCRELGLFDLSGREARHGGAKRDFGVALVWAATRVLSSGGKLGVVLPVTLFRGGKAGRSFRQFTIGPGVPLRVIQVEDLRELPIFPGTIRRTVLFFGQKGAPTVYPVPYYVWQKEGTKSKTCDADLPFRRTRLLARPSRAEDATSSWSVTTESGSDILNRIAGPSGYSAYLGANTAGANGIFWLEVIGCDRGIPIVRNCPQCGYRDVPSYEGPIEADLVYPLLRWRDVGQGDSIGMVILLVQDPFSRKAFPEEMLKSRYPLTYSYLCRFREVLEGRAARRKLQRNAPWYAQYNVGPYTLASYKIVWRRMDWHFRAVLVGSQPLEGVGKKPVVPQETCCFIPADSTDEGEYLVAVLNSRLVRAMMYACTLPGSRGFASPRILQTLAIPHYDRRSTLHRQLAEIGRKLVFGNRSRNTKPPEESACEVSLTDMQLARDKSRAWDGCMARLYGLSWEEYQELCSQDDGEL